MTPSPDAWCPSQAVAKVKNVAGWSSPVAREAHNLEVTGSNPVPATFFTPAGPSVAPAGCFFVLAPGPQPDSPAVCPMASAGFFCAASCRGTPIPEKPAAARLVAAGSVVSCGSLQIPSVTCGVGFRVATASDFKSVLSRLNCGRTGAPTRPARPRNGGPATSGRAERPPSPWSSAGSPSDWLPAIRLRGCPLMPQTLPALKRPRSEFDS